MVQYTEGVMPDCTDAHAFAEAVAHLTQAFGDATRRSIYIRCRDAADGGLTAAEIAKEFELHPNVARHHLDKLVEGGYLETDTRRADGSAAGRPSKRYHATDKDIVLAYPSRRDDLLASLLAQALESIEPGQATALAEKVGYDYGRSVALDMSPVAAPKSFHRAMRIVGEAMTAHGFEAKVEAEGRWHATLTAAHCPFGAAAHAHPHLICALDRGMVKGMMSALYGDTCPETRASLPGGDPICMTRV